MRPLSLSLSLGVSLSLLPGFDELLSSGGDDCWVRLHSIIVEGRNGKEEE